MPFLRRLTAAASSLLLLQLSLLGGGSLCAPSAADDLSKGTMVGMQHGAMTGSDRVDSGPASESDSTRAPSHDEHPCDRSSAPSACLSMAACAAVASVPAAGLMVTAVRLPSRVMVEPLSAAVDVAILPEVPPPRA